MHYPALPYLLPRLKRLPTLIIWGRQDPIVPLSAGQLYHNSIPGSRLSIIDNCGHRPEVEKPDEFIRLVQEFLQG
jgi:pimeloyl-ACP methyl ester carboxylesterase